MTRRETDLKGWPAKADGLKRMTCGPALATIKKKNSLLDKVSLNGIFNRE